MGMNARVLGMDMVNRTSQLADSPQRIASHPQSVTRVEIDSHHLASSVAQFEKCLRVIHKLVSMLFHTDPFDAVFVSIIYEVAPIRDRDILPLVTQNLMAFGGPCCGDPIR